MASSTLWSRRMVSGQHKSPRRLLAFGSCLFFLVGLFVYARSRSETSAEQWLASVGLSAIAAAFRRCATYLPALPSRWSQTVPDGLFAASLGCALATIWWASPVGRYLAVGAAAAFALAYEFAQLGHLVPGTFDPGDVVATLLGAVVALGLVSWVGRCRGRS